MRTLNNWLLPLLALGLLSGCTGMLQSVRDGIDRSNSEFAAAAATFQAKRTSGAVVRHAMAKIAGDEIEVAHQEDLPPIFSSKFNYLLASTQPLTDVLEDISRKTGIATIVRDQGVMRTGQPAASVSPISWSGTLRGLLDQVAQRTSMYWKYEHDHIELLLLETRTYNIYLPTGKRSIAASIALSGVSGSGNSTSSGSTSAGNSSSSGGSSSGNVSVSSTMDIDAYEAIRQSVATIVDGRASTGTAASTSVSATTAAATGSVIVNSTLGLLTVTTSPPIHDRIAQYVRSLNERFAQNVMINVKVYNVTARRGANAGTSLSLAYENLARNYGIGITGTPNLSPSSGTPGTIVIDALPGTRFSGTSLLMQALEQVGDVSLRTSGQVIAANGQPTPLQIANDVTYLASSTTTTVANAGTTTTLTPATRTIGFTANFLPLIIGDNRILLQYQINLSSLLGMNQVISNGSMIQTPNVATQSLQQQAYVKDGQTIALFGFEQERSTLDTSSGITGVSRNADSERNMMVIVLEVFSGK